LLLEPAHSEPDGHDPKEQANEDQEDTENSDQDDSNLVAEVQTDTPQT
ncbi:MAG: hypothetical protein GY732_04915, partial [Gammaproteobacteria bacterium]|nr:hypothetical protein [Gammaproteobacteria bacterium]